METPDFRLEFLRTYRTKSGLSGAEVAYLYSKVMATAEEGASHAIGTRTGINRSRIRGWIENGDVPDAVRGERIANQHGWLRATGEVHLNMSELVGATFAAGTIIEENYRVTWLRQRDYVGELLRSIGTFERYIDRNGRWDEIGPRNDPSVLGRVLHVRGVPVGDAASWAIPEYVTTSVMAARAFIRGFAKSRGRSTDDGYRIDIGSRHGDEFEAEFAALVEDTLEGPIRRVSGSVIVPERTVENDRWLTNTAWPINKRKNPPDLAT